MLAECQRASQRVLTAQRQANEPLTKSRTTNSLKKTCKPRARNLSAVKSFHANQPIVADRQPSALAAGALARYSDARLALDYSLVRQRPRRC
jgi:hypothetical protein